MPNAYIPRATVHDWSEHIAEHQDDHKAALARLLKDQRRLAKHVEENRESLQQFSGGIATYFIGVIVRMFELAGGRMRGATWEQIRAAEAKIGAEVGNLLPIDDKFPERVRAVAWRAQPHILDEALMALFTKPTGSDEVDMAGAEKAKVFFLIWVATEVLDQNWQPKPEFKGEGSYTYVHVEPK